MSVTVVEHLSAIAGDYDVLLCDIWGVIHNGVEAFPEACAALSRYRDGGGRVVLVTNSPRPSPSVILQLESLKVPHDCYDAVVSSGDVTRSIILSRPGQTVFHLGPERDKPTFDGLDVAFRDDAEADYVVCTGLFDDTRETPDDYRGLLAGLLARGLFMACANPDEVVDRGGTLIYCAGALADLYRTMGGEVQFAGKPYPPIYAEAMAKAEAARRANVPRARVLAIGDSVRTDFTGAHNAGIDFLFVTSGIHAEEFGALQQEHRDALGRTFDSAGGRPKAVAPSLRW